MPSSRRLTNFAVAEDRRATVAHLLGDMHKAITLYDESMAIWQELGDRSNCAWSLLSVRLPA